MSHHGTDATIGPSRAELLFLECEHFMLTSHWATVHDGRIELADNIALPEGARLLVTLLPEDEAEFWQRASESSLTAVWDNAEDDAYAQLLEG